METQLENETRQAVGREVKLRDGLEKVTGRTRYSPDVSRPGMLHCRLLHSPYAHARITRLDTSTAEAYPGVVRVVTAAELPEIEPTSRHRLLLARDRVLFVGHPVAAVLAETEGAAADALDLIEVEYEILPAVTTIEQAMQPDAPLVWPEGRPGGAGEAGAHGAAVGEAEETDEPSNATSAGTFERGDVDTAFAEVERAGGVTVEYTFQTPWVHQSYLEPHATVVEIDPLTDTATVWTSTQAQFYVREEMASILGLEDTAIRVIPMTVGGGFGGKFILMEPLVGLLAQLVGRPVKFVMTRTDEFVNGNPAPEGRIELKAAAMPDGTLHAIQARVLFDTGVYPGAPSGIAAYLLASYYRCPNLDVKAWEVFTNKFSTGAYRAPGAPQAAWAIESAVDDLAEELGMDPLSFRLQNVAEDGDPRADGEPWPTIGWKKCLQALAEHPAWQEARRESEPNTGWGMALGGWLGGIEPASAVCMMERDGTLNIRIGSIDLTGTNTTMALIAAEVFGLSPDRVKVHAEDTDTAPYAGASGGSKITYTVGTAVLAAAYAAREQLLKVASEQLEAAPEDLELRDGYVQVRGAPGSRRSLSEIADSTMTYGGRFTPIFASGSSAQTIESPGVAVHLARVRVDPATGESTILRFIAFQDVGRALNPAAIRGQIEGGATQGIGWALREEMIFDEGGQLLTASLMDYALPKATDVPPTGIETVLVEVPSPEGPFGARPVGEPPVIPAAGAIANAIHAATGVRPTVLPMTAPRLWAQMQSNGM